MFLDTVSDIKEINWNDVLNTITNWCLNDGVKIIIALVAMFISFKIINLISRKIKKNIDKKKIDKTIALVTLSVFRKLAKFVIILIAMGYLGLETSGLAALLASAGLGIGLAVQGTLSNFAGGILILVTRPFKLGDYIEANGLSGTVESMEIIYTKLCTPDNKVITIPNGPLANSSITNYSTKDLRRLDMEFSISYKDDFAKAEAIIKECITKSGLFEAEPAPFVNVIRHNTNSIDLVARIWVKQENYWTLHFELLESVKNAFDEAGITIPFPQIEISNKN